MELIPFHKSTLFCWNLPRSHI